MFVFARPGCNLLWFSFYWAGFDVAERGCENNQNIQKRIEPVTRLCLETQEWSGDQTKFIDSRLIWWPDYVYRHKIDLVTRLSKLFPLPDCSDWLRTLAWVQSMIILAVSAWEFSIVLLRGSETAGQTKSQLWESESLLNTRQQGELFHDLDPALSSVERLGDLLALYLGAN